MRIRSIVILVVFGVVGIGCASTYTPDPDTYDLEAIPEFRSSEAVTLLNQGEEGEVFLSANGPERFFGNPRAYTESALEIARRELAERGMRPGDGAERTLALAVRDLHGETSAGGFAFRVTLVLDVTRGDGARSSYEAANRSTYFVRVADGAVMRAVTAMLADPEIVAYLGGTPLR